MISIEAFAILTEGEAFNDVQLATVFHAGASIEVAFGETDGVNDQRIAIPTPDRMSRSAWRNVIGVYALVEVDRPNDVHKAIGQLDGMLVLIDLVDVLIKRPINQDVGRSAMESRIVFSLIACRCCSTGIRLLVALPAAAALCDSTYLSLSRQALRGGPGSGEIGKAIRPSGFAFNVAGISRFKLLVTLDNLAVIEGYRIDVAAVRLPTRWNTVNFYFRSGREHVRCPPRVPKQRSCTHLAAPVLNFTILANDIKVHIGMRVHESNLRDGATDLQ